MTTKSENLKTGVILTGLGINLQQTNHFQNVCSPDLREVDALSVSEGDDLVEGEEQVERVVQDLSLVHRAAVLGDL